MIYRPIFALYIAIVLTGTADAQSCFRNTSFPEPAPTVVLEDVPPIPTPARSIRLSGLITQERIDAIAESYRDASTLELDCRRAHFPDGSLELLKVFEKQTVIVDLSLSNISDDSLDSLKDFNRLEVLILAHTRITGSRLDQLSSITSLHTLDLTAIEFGDDSVPSLASLKHIKRLTLNVHNLSRDGFASLCTKMKSLRSLVLSAAGNIDNSWLPHLADIPRLNVLNLGFANKLDDDAIPLLAHLPALRWLSLEGTSITGAFPTDLGNLTKLDTLSLAHCTFEESQTLESLSKLRSLKQLSLNDCKNVTSLKFLRGMSKLEAIGLRETSLPDAALKELQYCPHLKYIDLDSCNVGKQTLATLSEMRALQSMALGNTEVDSNDLTAFSNCRHLRIVSLRRTEVTDSVFNTLAKFPDLAYIDLRETPVSGSQVSVLKNHRNLHSILLITEKLDERISHSLAEFKALKEILLESREQFTFELAPFASANTLESLRLYNPILPEGVTGIHAFTQLKRLEIAGTSPQEEFAKPLRRVPSLQYLHLSGIPVSRAETVILSDLPHLESLTVYGKSSNLGWIENAHLCPSLIFLAMTHRTSLETLQQYRKEHPGLNILFYR